MRYDPLHLAYEMGNMKNETCMSVFALALMSRTGSGIIQLDETGVSEFCRLTGLQDGEGDYVLCHMIESGLLKKSEGSEFATLDFDAIEKWNKRRMIEGFLK